MTGSLPRRPFTGLLVAQFTSVLGTSMSALAIPWLVLTSTGSATRMGLIAFAEMAPYVAMQALGGPLIDRIGARRVYVLGNAAAAAAICAIPALYAADLLPLGALACLAAAAGAVRGLADCAGQVLVPGTASLGAVPLERAAGLHGSANQTGLFVGASVTGILVSALGAPTVVLIDGISFGLAAALVALLVPAAAEPQRIERRLSTRQYVADLGEGVRFIRTNRLMLALVAMIAVTNLLDQGINAVLVPVWVRERLQQPDALGLIAGALGAGAIIGALIAAWLGPRLPRRIVFTFGVLIAGAPLSLVLALTGTLPIALAVAFVAGLGTGGLNPILNAVLYERIPPQLRARTLGSLKASAWIGTPIGPLLAGSLIEAIGLRSTLFAFAAIFLVATAVPVMLPVMRNMNRAPHLRADGTEARDSEVVAEST
ncbi:MFS transporter [Amycolatopsis sp. QT-25]|uniref:MFS transporter n=1 Tax=Amycolatopsis sp. QT-25 TaxID=3034022 RepID=UPI0023EB4EC7|nr:MFS transporter [Amycolatopsis sp. QT-25]WET82980.1 MFS transporter [Amycolatopsis sp. QT-25]